MFRPFMARTGRISGWLQQKTRYLWLQNSPLWSLQGDKKVNLRDENFLIYFYSVTEFCHWTLSFWYTVDAIPFDQEWFAMAVQ